MKNESRKIRLLWMAEDTAPSWTFLTNHAQVLVSIAHDPGIRLRDIGDRVGMTERAAHRIVTELADAGCITRERNGSRLCRSPARGRQTPRFGRRSSCGSVSGDCGRSAGLN